MSENTIDVSHLPRYAFGKRSALFWGVLLFAAAEGTALAILFVAYLYVRGNYDQWPPDQKLDLAPGIITCVLMLASCIPIHLSLRPCHALALRPTRIRLLIGTMMGLLACVARAWEIARIPFRWTDNAYASVVWMSIGAHTIELGASVIEGFLMAAVLYRGPVEEKHFEDNEVTAIFWYFAVLIWIPFAVLFYVDGRVR